MKTLLLLRHAKSSWKEIGVPDHDRRLNRRGQRDAPRVGEHLREIGLVPDLIVSSTARRARKTAEKVADTCGYKGEIQLEATLYDAAPDTCLDILRRLPPGNDCVMLVGHNPCLDELVARLTGVQEHLGTATVARVGLNLADWGEVRGGSGGNLISMWRPPRDG